MRNEIEIYKQKVLKLESELDEMTVALSQAWDQLTPLLQSTPEQANLTQDILPVFASVMTGIGANKVAAFMLENEEFYCIPDDIVLTTDLRTRLRSLQSESATFQFELPARQEAKTENWLFAPIIVESQIVGVIGVGSDTEQKVFSAVDVRILERMAERTASQILAAHLAQSRQRELFALRELQIANLIQRSIQPIKAPTAPHIQVAVHWQPAKSVGGDAWGWVKRPNGEIGCFLLDVSGKGLPAALAAVSLHTAIKMLLRLDLSVTEVVKQVNEEFYPVYARSELLATICVMVINPTQRLVKQANAGHPPTLIRMNGEWTRWAATAPPIGTLPFIDPECQEVQLENDDLVLFYSDGFTEIENQDGFWGEEGLLAAIPPDNNNNVEQIVQHIVRAADQMQESGPAHDDQTLVVIHMAD